MKESEQEYSCTGEDIFTLYGLIVGMRHISSVADQSGANSHLAMTQHFQNFMDLPAIKDARDIYLKVREEKLGVSYDPPNHEDQ